jgi:5-methylcytosine-specific restriction endonuclease McrA
MNGNSWEGIIDNSDLPEEAKLGLTLIVRVHGYEWMTEIELATDRKGDGASPGISIELLSLDDLPPELIASLDALKGLVEANPPEITKERGLEMFLMECEFIYEDAQEFSAEQEGLDSTEVEARPIFDSIIHSWISLRIDYLRTLESMKTNWARSRAYEEINAVQLGGEELACNTCGALFWDNLDILRDAERYYCSIRCQELVEMDCINCGTHFVVGRARHGFRNRFRLNGFCDSDCAQAEWSRASADKSYVNGIRKRLESTGADVDESISRRDVFKRFEGKCYICEVETHWTIEGKWDPFLATVDHIKPVSKGGSHTWENVALACLICNVRKGAKYPS